MTNGSKFVTVHERIEAFRKYCEKMHDRPGESCGKQEWCSTCSLKWLDLECEEEKIETVEDVVNEMLDWPVAIDTADAKYLAKRILAAHNRVAKKSMEGK